MGSSVDEGMDEPDFAKILYEGHPAEGTERSAFQFLISDPATGAPVRFLLVEAENAWAVAAIEKILLRDGRVNDTCRIIAIFRDHRFAGVRDDLLEEVPYADFMVDIVDHDRLTGSPVVAACFSKSLSAKERTRVARRAAESAGPSPARAEPIPAPAPGGPPGPVPESGNSDILTSALCGMGFKKPEVKKFVSSLGRRVESEPVPQLLREGLRALAA